MAIPKFILLCYPSMPGFLLPLEQSPVSYFKPMQNLAAGRLSNSVPQQTLEVQWT